MSCVAYIGFGSNLGDSIAIYDQARAEIASVEGIRLKRCSPLYRSKPVGVPGEQNDFINAVFQIETSLNAESVLFDLNRIENKNGRSRSEVRNLARTLDLDLLLFGNKRMKSKLLTIPHPRIYQRAFVLFPLFDLTPELEVPGQGQVQTLLEGVKTQELEKL